MTSHPARGAWIEIYDFFFLGKLVFGRTPRGVRGLKSITILKLATALTVAPREGCVD